MIRSEARFAELVSNDELNADQFVVYRALSTRRTTGPQFCGDHSGGRVLRVYSHTGLRILVKILAMCTLLREPVLGSLVGANSQPNL
jgi:hypothetical protein